MPGKLVIWRSATLSGVVVLLAAHASICADFVLKGGIDFIDEHFGAFQIAALAGMVFCIVGLVGWGTSSAKSVCAGIGAAALIASIAVCCLGALVGGTNVHGPFFLIFLPMLSIAFSGVVLLLIAGFRRDPRGA